MYICMYEYIYICVFIDTYIHTYIYIYIYIYVLTPWGTYVFMCLGIISVRVLPRCYAATHVLLALHFYNMCC